MASSTVIVFGASGAVGSAAARAAAEQGARVVLAMRDTTKAIPGLDGAVEKALGVQRVVADLTQPETVRAAVAHTGARRAFFYLQLGSSDHMRATIEAMKAGGIELAVFLSSVTARSDLTPHDPPGDIIEHAHSMVEFNLAEVFGADHFVALRGGWFASNVPAYYKKDIARGEIQVWGPDAGFDAVVPSDIGRVAGTILAKGPQDDRRIIYLFGPSLMTQLEVVQIIIKELNIDAKIKIVNDRDEAMRLFHEDRGFPRPLADSLVDVMGKKVDSGAHSFGINIAIEDLGNVEKYSGQKAMSFKEWLQENKQQLLS